MKVEKDTWIDVKEETYRVYTFPNGSYKVEKVIAFYLSTSGGHRLKTAGGSTYFIPAGWLGLEVNAPEMTVQ